MQKEAEASHIFSDWREKEVIVHKRKNRRKQSVSLNRNKTFSSIFSSSSYLRLSPVSCVLGLYGLVGAPSIHLYLQRMDWSIAARSKSLRKVTYIRFLCFEFLRFKWIVRPLQLGFKYSMMLFRSYIGYIYMLEDLERVKSTPGSIGKAWLKLSWRNRRGASVLGAPRRLLKPRGA